MSAQPPLLIILIGETASGKSDLALDLAAIFNGEIIAADSRTFYKGLDIGTAKPSNEQRQAIPHHLIDVATPKQQVTAADFKKLANQAINDISARGKLAFVVGGTGLYVDTLIYDFPLVNKTDPALRSRLQHMTVKELQDELTAQNIPLPTNAKNPRHLIRRLEVGGEQPNTVRKLRKNTLVLALKLEPEELRRRIVTRIDDMFTHGLEAEARRLFTLYASDSQLNHTIAYQEFLPYFMGNASLIEVREKIIQHTGQYAKRQRTWFRRNTDINWICKKDEAVELITTFLNKAPTV